MNSEKLVFTYGLSEEENTKVNGNTSINHNKTQKIEVK